ncbi:MAG: hypothetical protein V4707_13215 [Pseudomonadota bacterium]
MTDALADRLSGIEAAALATYAAHGLPTAPGHYRKGPRARGWTFLGADIEPEARWAMVLERPPETGWRHGALEAIGGHDRNPAVQAASRALTACRALRDQLSTGESVSADDVAALLEVAGALEKPRSRLRFKPA